MDKKLKWSRLGDTLTARRENGTEYEITRDELEPGQVEWLLRINGVWEETFSRLKDAKYRADGIKQVTVVATEAR